MLEVWKVCEVAKAEFDEAGDSDEDYEGDPDERDDEHDAEHSNDDGRQRLHDDDDLDDLQGLQGHSGPWVQHGPNWQSPTYPSLMITDHFNYEKSGNSGVFKIWE